MTGRELVSASLRLIGAVAPGESPTATEATDGLASMNRMIDSWSTEGLLIHAKVRETPFTLTASDATVTIGSSGDINVLRPMTITAAAIQDASTGVEFPLRLLTESEYAEIPLKTATATYPTDLFDDGAYPLRTLTLYPVPSAAHKLVLYTFRPLTTIATLDTSISLPPGYERALVYNGAIELGPEYGKATSVEVLKVAEESKANIKRANHREHLLTPDPVITGGGVYDIYSGGYR